MRKKPTEAEEMAKADAEHTATFNALMEWLLQHDVVPETVIDAAGFWLGIVAKQDGDDLPETLALAHKILDDAFKSGTEKSEENK